jgi:hypothetical protein
MTCSIALALFVVFVSFYYFQSRAAISGNKPICQGGRLLTSLSRWRLPIGMGCARRSLKFMLLALERRRIAHPKAQDYVDFQNEITAGIYDRRYGVRVSLHGSNRKPLMSALGQKRTSDAVPTMSAIIPKADIGRRACEVHLLAGR